MFPGRETFVPGDYESISEALTHTANGDKLHIQNGSYSFHDPAMVERRLYVTGEEDTFVIGPWSLKKTSGGLFQSLSLGYKMQEGLSLRFSCMASFSSAWIFEDCEIRGIHCLVFAMFETSDMKFLACNLGGMKEEDDYFAINALIGNDRSRAFLFRCRLENTGEILQRPPRKFDGTIIIIQDDKRVDDLALLDDIMIEGGVRAADSSEIQLEQCSLHNNDVSLHLSRRGRIIASRCVLRCGEFSLFSASSCMQPSALELQDCELMGQSWMNRNRPHVFLRFKDGREVESYINTTASGRTQPASEEERRRRAPSPEQDDESSTTSKASSPDDSLSYDLAQGRNVSLHDINSLLVNIDEKQQVTPAMQRSSTLRKRDLRRTRLRGRRSRARSD